MVDVSFPCLLEMHRRSCTSRATLRDGFENPLASLLPSTLLLALIAWKQLRTEPTANFGDSALYLVRRSSEASTVCGTAHMVLVALIMYLVVEFAKVSLH